MFLDTLDGFATLQTSILQIFPFITSFWFLRAERIIMKFKNVQFDQYAIFETGGKQYQALPNKTIAVEKLEGDVGSTIEFKEVLFRKTGKDQFEFGLPYVENASVKASIVKHFKEPKKIIFKFGRRKKTRTKKGHRQPMTVIRIESI